LQTEGHDVAISPDTLEIIGAIAAGITGTLGVGAYKKRKANGNGAMTRETHDRECGLKLKPIMDALERIERHLEKT
jgi:hypothetical protein